MRRRLGSSRRRGSVLVWVTIALFALLGVTALAIDITRLYIAAQRAQQVADGSAFGGGQELPNSSAARNVALGIAAANTAELPAWPAVVASSDVTYYPPGSSIYRPDGSLITTLGATSHGLMVVAHVSITCGLARIVGITDGTATRYAVVVRGASNGMHVAPIWISKGSAELYTGQPLNLIKSSTAVDTNGDGLPDTVPPGNFGFLDFAVPGEDWFTELLSGYNISEAVYNGAVCEANQLVTGYTGEHTGSWVQSLENQVGQLDGTARLERAAADPIWSTQTFGVKGVDFQPDNPRLLQVPIVEYQGSNGTNATFKVVGFAEMWLDAVVTAGGDKAIQVRFVEYHNFAGADGDISPELGGRGGVFVVQPLL